MNIYYLGGSNFGDALTGTLYKLVTGDDITPCDPLIPGKTVCIGSIAHAAYPGDFIWGAGILSADTPLACDSTTTALAVRGPLTMAHLAAQGVKPCGVYGDPSLLLPKFHRPLVDITPIPKVIPHYVDKELVGGIGLRIVDVHWQPLVIIKELAGAEWVASSSLHGLSVAEAYGVPAVWVEFSNEVAGKGFKFRDYYLGTGREPPEPVDCRGGWNLPVVEQQLSSWTPPIVHPNLLTTCPFYVPTGD